MKISEIVLKTSSICNLNCKYCYVFNKGDKTHEEEPNLLSNNVLQKFLEKLEEYAYRSNQESIMVILHGGEPLLAGKEFYQNLIELTNRIVKSTKVYYTLQTNGTLLTEEWCKLFNKLNIKLGISFDGSYNACSDRVFKKDGKNAYNNIIEGIQNLKNIEGYACVLSVINTNENPQDIYRNIKELELYYVSFLYPDDNYKTNPSNYSKFGDWLIEIFDLWYSDESKEKPKILLPFDTIMRKLLGVPNSGTEMIGQNENSVISVKTNGKIELVDTLKICGDGFTKTKYNIFENKLDDIFEYDLFIKYYYAHKEEYLSTTCKNCLIMEICGGGQLAQRFSEENGFDNPSLYCYEIKKVIAHIQNKLVDDMPKNVREECKIEKINLHEI